MLVLVAGLLVAPGFVDWTPYRAAFAERLSAATGRNVGIEGDVDFVLLPRPALNAGAVRMGGRVTDDYVAIEQLSARLAFLPLLTGQLKFRELVLTRADARITRSAEGNVDLLSPTPAPPAAGGAAPPPPRDFDLQVERLVINQGTIVFQDIVSTATINLRDINATVRAGTNITAAGGMTIGDVPVTLDAIVGRLTAGGVRTLSLTAKLDEADATAKFAGNVFTRESELRGDLTLSGTNVAGLASGLGLRDASSAAPPAAQKPVTLTAKLRGSGQAVTLDPIAGEIGGVTLKGNIAWRAGTPSQADIAISFGAIDLASWQTAALAPPSGLGVVGTAHAQTPPAPPAATFTPPKNLSATINLQAPVLTYRGQTLSGAAFKATLADQVLTVTDASISLPGASRLAVTGTARLGEENGITAAVTAQSGDLRALLAWIGWTPPEGKLQPGRLGTGSLQAALRSTDGAYALDNLVAVVDISTFTGSAAWTPGARPFLGLDLAVNTFNADAYAPLLEGTPTATPAQPTPAAAAAPGGYGVTPAFASFAALADFDADVRLQVDAVTAGGIPGGKVGFDLGLQDGTLQLRTASFENVGGVTAWFSGGIGGFGAAPSFDDLQFDLSAQDLARVGRAFTFEVPESLAGLKPISLTGTVKGSLAESTVSATLKAAALTVQADGQALTLEQEPKYNFTLAAAQPSYAALMKSMGVVWPVGTPDPGAFKLSARISHDKTQTVLEAIDLRVGDGAAQGALTFTRGDQSTVNGSLTGLSLSLDRLWPAPPPPRAPAAAKPVRGVPPPPKPPVWSEEPFDWSVLSKWQGNVELSGKVLTVRGLQAQDFSTKLTFGEGAAEITDWKGKLFGAPGQVFVRLAATPVPKIQGEIAFIGGDLSGVAAALNKGVAAPRKTSGRADFAGSFRAEGASPAAFAASLTGSGTAKVNATDAGGGAISGFLGAITAANQLEGSSSPVTLEARFSAADGKIRIEDATVASKSYGGAFSGTIDIARWLVDLTGRLRLEAGAAAKPASVPITVKGALDLPNVTLLPAR